MTGEYSIGILFTFPFISKPFPEPFSSISSVVPFSPSLYIDVIRSLFVSISIAPLMSSVQAAVSVYWSLRLLRVAWIYVRHSSECNRLVNVSLYVLRFSFTPSALIISSASMFARRYTNTFFAQPARRRERGQNLDNDASWKKDTSSISIWYLSSLSDFQLSSVLSAPILRTRTV